jgi:hypothetical protein
MRRFFISVVAIAIGLIHCGESTSDTANDGGFEASAADANVSDAGSGDASVDAFCAPLARVQSAFGSDDAGGSDSFTVALPNATQAHDFIVVGVDYFDCAAITSVTDTAGNAYESLVSVSGNAHAGDLETWGASNILAVANDAITVHFTTACNARDVKVAEYSGIDTVAPVVQTADLFGEGGAPDASLTTDGRTVLFAHTADSEMCVGPGNGFVAFITDGWSTIAEDRVVTSAGAFSVGDQPAAGERWGIQAVALRGCR